MNDKDNALIFDIKHYAIHDGPGIRTTVFFKGCPLRCGWCANPESQETVPEILFDASLCQQCQACATACPEHAIVFRDNARLYDRDACTGCGRCAKACAFDALELCGKKIAVETLWQEIKDDRAFWDRSGGGVTLSGGEPLVQFPFIRRFLELCQSHRVHTAVETCGSVPEKIFTRTLDLVDFMFFDVKLAEPDGHKINTGVSNHLIAKNLTTLANSSTQGLVRIPLIPGINNTAEALEQMGKFLSGTACGLGIELLPYHRLGEKKYEKLGRPYPLTSIALPTPDQMEAAASILAGHGLRLVSPAKESLR